MEKLFILEDSNFKGERDMKAKHEFIDSYNEAVNRDYNFDCIFADFSYNLSYESLGNVCVNEINGMIADEFKNLSYKPSNLFFNFNGVHAIWFVPDGYDFTDDSLDYEIGNLINNLENQLINLKLCRFNELCMGEGNRELYTDFYSDNFYRKNEFDKLLHTK